MSCLNIITFFIPSRIGLSNATFYNDFGDEESANIKAKIGAVRGILTTMQYYYYYYYYYY